MSVTKERIGELYVILLNRIVEKDGLEYWQKEGENKIDVEIANEIIKVAGNYGDDYPEYSNLDETNPESVRKVIENIFRAFNKDYQTDPAGIDYWVNDIVKNGKSIGEVAVEIINIADRLAIGDYGEDLAKYKDDESIDKTIGAFKNKVEVALYATKRIKTTDIDGDGKSDIQELKKVIENVTDDIFTLVEAERKVVNILKPAEKEEEIIEQVEEEVVIHYSSIIRVNEDSKIKKDGNYYYILNDSKKILVNKEIIVKEGVTLTAEREFDINRNEEKISGEGIFKVEEVKDSLDLSKVETEKTIIGRITEENELKLNGSEEIEIESVESKVSIEGEEEEQKISIKLADKEGVELDISEVEGEVKVEGEGDKDYKVITGKGKNEVITLGGDDVIIAKDTDIINGEAGKDIVRFNKEINKDNLRDNNLKNIEKIEIINTKNDTYDFSEQTEDLEIIGNIGKDTIIGGEGNDIIEGGKGADKLKGGKGNDLIIAEDVDVIDGGKGADIIEFNKEVSKDNLRDSDLVRIEKIEITNKGDATYDFSIQKEKLEIEGNEGDDTIRGGKGNDIIKGEYGNDIIEGDEGDDKIYGDCGNDTIRGGKGNDYLDGGYGNDYLDGGNGNDLIIAEDIDEIDGGEGEDIVQFDKVVSEDNLKDDDLVNIEKIEIINTGVGTYNFSVQIEDLEIEGNNGDDTIRGGEGNDIIKGKGGYDKLYGGDGSDSLYGEDGYDKLYGGDGYDYLYGGEGSDSLYGGDGNDMIEGGDGNDMIEGNDGDDTIYGGEQNDTIGGGEGNDYIYGENGNDTLSGWKGDDYLYGGEGNDIIKGEEGNDIIKGEEGDDYLYGGNGNDLIIAEDIDVIDGGYGSDIVQFNKGVSKDNLTDADLINVEKIEITNTANDIYDFSNQKERLNIIGGVGRDTIIAGTGNDTIIAEDIDAIDGGEGADIVQFDKGVSKDNLTDADLINIEKIEITNKGDATYDFSVQKENLEIIGNIGKDIIYGESGKDIIKGNYGDDTINGGDGNDIIYGGDGDDTINGGDGNDYLDGEYGNDIIIAEDIDVIDGGYGSDIVQFNKGVSKDNLTDDDLVNIGKVEIINTGDATYDFSVQTEDLEIIGNIGKDIIYGGHGDYIIDGKDGDDTINGGDGKDTIYGGHGDDTINGGGGNDIIYGQFGANKIDGGDGSDRIYGGTKDNIIDGGDGNDIIYGGWRNDTINGGIGIDYLDGDHGDDTINGGDGNDIIKGNYGNDTINGGTGNDTIDGGYGADIIYGGDGDDKFIFSILDENGTQSGIQHSVDTIKDYTEGSDVLLLGGILQMDGATDGDTSSSDTLQAIDATSTNNISSIKKMAVLTGNHDDYDEASEIAGVFKSDGGDGALDLGTDDGNATIIIVADDDNGLAVLWYIREKDGIQGIDTDNDNVVKLAELIIDSYSDDFTFDENLDTLVL